MDINIANSNIVTAFDDQTVGTKVLSPDSFVRCLKAAIAEFDWSKCKQSGQGKIALPDEALAYVSAGVGERTNDPEDYVARMHRGRVGLYLKRERAASATDLAAIVYTRDAYLADPEVKDSPSDDASHILVAVLASAGPEALLSPLRFTSNLAGGNNEALGWNAEIIQAKAWDVIKYDKEWCVVAD